MIIHEIKLKGKHMLRISRNTVNGMTFGQLRLWEKDSRTNQLIVTQKGFSFDLDSVYEIIKGLVILKALSTSCVVEA
jgi:hypothetical protein